MRDIIVIAHNMRSIHNVGSLLRTAEGLAVKRVYMTGYTPYPPSMNDQRLPHDIAKIAKHVHKTALGAEESQDWEYHDDITQLISQLKAEGYMIAALEQSVRSIKLSEFRPPEKLAIVTGREVEGLESEILEMCDTVLEIPMLGKKESFNVVQAAAMSLYHCRFSYT